MRKALRVRRQEDPRQSSRLLKGRKSGDAAVVEVLRRMPAHKKGTPMDQIETPALCVDLDLLDQNMAKMKASMEPFKGKVTVRPHIKSHKCGSIAAMQTGHKGGDCVKGVCCAKVSEVEAMCLAGIKDIHLANVVFGQSKMDRLAHCASLGTAISICVDSAKQIDQLEAAAKKHGTTLQCLVEVNTGQNRCGVEYDGPEVATLALDIARRTPWLSFEGLQGYQGWAQHITAHKERAAEIDRVCDKMIVAKKSLSDVGLPCRVITGAGTGSYPMEAASGVYTEVQPGSYLFNDGDYQDLENSAGAVVGQTNWPRVYISLPR